MESQLAIEQVAKQGGGSSPLTTTGLCLLSLDGGGVRGLSTLYILRRLMTRLNHERRNAKLPAVKPCEVFDLIGGTSTGGYVYLLLCCFFTVSGSCNLSLTRRLCRLIAIMLGRLEMDVDKCIQAYNKFMKTVFKREFHRSSIS